MLRRDLLRALLASPLTGWLRPSLWATLIGPAADVTNAADLYRKVFDWSNGMTAEETDRLEVAETASIDDPDLRALLRKARPMLDAVRKAATTPTAVGRTKPSPRTTSTRVNSPS